ncbi:alpha-galactosidase [Paenibacillus sp. FSL H7-0357]|uniref:alpha-galactosidase n=1 Tax=Paenibacillus sp. FSL H7-0357 TaxID=1536774 RepID=UPI0004F87FF8|nr:alpha-galactosidase [Paenibacillus sp. FSL H7-0357]AIQ17705.1 alpha-galactosidase [Paenibacillus sp. FSL H7-0357]
MPVIYHEKTKQFHLYNDDISYIFCVMLNQQLGHLYYGKRIQDQEDFSHLLEWGFRDMSPCVFEGNPKFSLEQVKQEVSVYGAGDLRSCGLHVVQQDGSSTTHFEYLSHHILPGKPSLEGLPATYVEEDNEADTVCICLIDKTLSCQVELQYTLFNQLPVLTRSMKIIHSGTEKIRLEAAMSFSLELPDKEYEMLTLTGAWGRERHIQNVPLHQGIQSIYSLRGHSSHNYNPFIGLKRKETTEFLGEAIGFSLVYSGNFLAQAEVDTYDVTRIMMGIHPHGFSWVLEPGDSFQTPESVLVYSDKGLNRMSQVFHELYQTRLVRGFWRDRERPILINNWEATYMNFDEDKILGLARAATGLGIELFVLDDGWFGERNTDTTSLGDWYPNKVKLPNGISGLASKITAMGLKFGLWFEPEMISKASKLYEKHPDWLLSVPYRTVSPGRNQYVLDLTKAEVIDYLDQTLSHLLAGSDISYVKWDMNRSMSEVFSQGRECDFQGRVYHQYILGIYELHERLTSKFPEVLFESCASGGGRFDPGMLYYSPQGWISDNTDAVERLKIQYGTSMVYPLSSMGSHVSAVPNHQTSRSVSLNTRGSVAYFGTFGYELDISLLSDEEKATVQEQITFMKKYRGLMARGTFYRLASPFQGNETAWMVRSRDRSRAIVGYYRILTKVNDGYRRLKLAGLDPHKKYRIAHLGEHGYFGDELMEIGIVLNDHTSGDYHSKVPRGDFLSRIFILEAD